MEVQEKSNSMNHLNITVGLSGGVDSSVAAFLLKQENHNINAIFMQNWQDIDDKFCSIKQDALDAISVADILDIDIDIINFSQEYYDRVFKFFIEEYKQGRTPNPDVFCNQEIKFKCFLDYAIKQGAQYIATGHYAIKEIKDNIHYLKKAKDIKKDQTYFLYRLNHRQIEKSIFPLGNYTKQQVRSIANSIKLPTSNKKDSTGICFIGERPFRDFLLKYISKQPGPIVTMDNEIIGEHIGLSFYTIGQRKGLSLGGQKKPWFVAKKNISKNELIVVQGHSNCFLYSKQILINNLNFTLKSKFKEGIFQVKIRYQMQEVLCSTELVSLDEIKITFQQAQWAVAIGQSAVLYDKDICIGGGIIAKILK